MEKSGSAIEFVYCKCGCEKTTSKYVLVYGKPRKNRPKKFISGHNSKGENNSCRGKHPSDETRKKMSEIRKEMNISGEKHPNYKGGKIIRRGYYYILHPERKFQQKWRYIQEHRYVMEQHIGRQIRAKEDVHHINGDKLDNRIENLELLTKAEHTKKHLEKQGYVINQFGLHKIN